MNRILMPRNGKRGRPYPLFVPRDGLKTKVRRFL